jgi:hypothetical protein
VRLSDLQKLPVGEGRPAGAEGRRAWCRRCAVGQGHPVRQADQEGRSLKGVLATKGAKAAIEAAGGSVAAE